MHAHYGPIWDKKDDILKSLQGTIIEDAVTPFIVITNPDGHIYMLGLPTRRILKWSLIDHHPTNTKCKFLRADLIFFIPATDSNFRFSYLNLALLLNPRSRQFPSISNSSNNKILDSLSAFLCVYLNIIVDISVMGGYDFDNWFDKMFNEFRIVSTRRHIE